MRLDVYLYKKGYAESRSRARFLITEGRVTIDGAIITKPSYDVDENTTFEVNVCPLQYVSVGGLKLQAALDRFELDVVGAVCADIGASTGGFTDCLLRHGAARVYAVDSGTSQLHPSLRADSRVIVMEGTNARDMTASSLPEMCSVVVCDVSFISLTLILPAIYEITAPDGHLVALIKPQFELDQDSLGSSGVVTSPRARADAVCRVISAAAELGLRALALTVSPVTGGAVENERERRRGNVEYLVLFKKTNDKEASPAITRADVMELIKSEKDCSVARGR